MLMTRMSEYLEQSAWVPHIVGQDLPPKQSLSCLGSHTGLQSLTRDTAHHSDFYVGFIGVSQVSFCHSLAAKRNGADREKCPRK